MGWAASSQPVDYLAAVAAMEARASAIAEGHAPELVWLLEHPPLYTAGVSAKAADLLQPDWFPVHAVGRGGQYTYHGPGQRVAYVMLDLTARRRDVRGFVVALEAWLIDALATSHKMRVPQGPAYAVGFNRNGTQGNLNSGLPPDVEAALRSGQLPYGVVIDNSNVRAPPVKWVTVRVPLQNSEVLDALRTLSQQNFGYDKRAWRLWWQAQL